MRILLVEDDAQLGEALSTGLKQFNMTVDWLMDGRLIGRTQVIQVHH